MGVITEILGWIKETVNDSDKVLNKSHHCNAYDICMDYLKEQLGKVSYLFKDADYLHEDEKRIIYMLDSFEDPRIVPTKGNPARLLVYSDEPAYIKEIILGPKFKATEDNLPYLQYRCDILAKKLGTDSIKIKKSKIEYI